MSYFCRSMIKNSLLASFILAFFVVSCSKQSPQATGPAAVVLTTYQSLQNQDSIGSLQTLTMEKQDEYEMYPDQLNRLLAMWKGDTAHVTILNVKQKDSTATVLYNLSVTGAKPRHRDSVSEDLYLRDGEWKHGF
jgi:hypothetical protein